tara:strand:+ start:117 stop:320 length:204 start_codon:yes stop_codon:yes gene_type:complete
LFLVEILDGRDNIPGNSFSAWGLGERSRVLVVSGYIKLVHEVSEVNISSNILFESVGVCGIYTRDAE